LLVLLDQYQFQFDQIQQEGAPGGPIKAKTLLDDKGAVNAEG
jgi:hypothetical protein